MVLKKQTWLHTYSAAVDLRFGLNSPIKTGDKGCTGVKGLGDIRVYLASPPPMDGVGVEALLVGILETTGCSL